jgi:hypothetical protein
MKLQSLFISLIVLFLCSPNIFALTDESKAAAEVIKNYNVKGDFEGVVLVAKGGKVIHKQAVGLANANGTFRTDWIRGFEFARSPSSLRRCWSCS